jgi:hypothetical protein
MRMRVASSDGHVGNGRAEQGPEEKAQARGIPVAVEVGGEVFRTSAVHLDDRLCFGATAKTRARYSLEGTQCDQEGRPALAFG